MTCKIQPGGLVVCLGLCALSCNCSPFLRRHNKEQQKEQRTPVPSRKWKSSQSPNQPRLIHWSPPIYMSILASTCCTRTKQSLGGTWNRLSAGQPWIRTLFLQRVQNRALVSGSFLLPSRRKAREFPQLWPYLRGWLAWIWQDVRWKYIYLLWTYSIKEETQKRRWEREETKWGKSKREGKIHAPSPLV